MNAEHAFKDDLISNLKRSLEKKGFFGGSNTADIGLVRQLENEKEARLAQQQRIFFKFYFIFIYQYLLCFTKYI